MYNSQTHLYVTDLEIMECIYRRMAWDEALKSFINYTFTLFSEITKLDRFVKRHHIYTKAFFLAVQIHLKSPLFLKHFFKEPFIVIKG